MIDVLIPTYGRFQRLGRVYDDICAAGGPVNPVFVVESTDRRSIEAAEATGAQVVVNSRTPNYSGAINSAFTCTDGDAVFLGADDLHFHPGWAEAALAMVDDQFQVIGTLDHLNPYVTNGWHSTHSLVTREYIDTEGGIVDQGPGIVLFEGYTHQYTDTEFIGTAKMRVRFRPCFDSVVEHMHAYSGKGERPDATTAKGNANIAEDSALYDERRELWFSISR